MLDTNKIQQAYSDKKAKTRDKIDSLEKQNTHNEKLLGNDRIQKAIVETTRLNIEHRDGHEPKVTVKNFPKNVGTPDFKKIVEELKNLEKSLTPKNIDFKPLIKAVDSLKEQVAKIPTEHPEKPEPVEAVTVKNLETLKPSINKVEEAISKLKLDPKINVSPAQLPELDLTPVANIMGQIKESVLSIKIPDNSKDLKDVIKAQKGVQNAIQNLTFPVPNYVLPFKNTEGAATQVQLDSNGNLPIVANISGADGAILDGANSAIKATVKDLSNSNPLTTALVDANGDQITSFGGGVQYTEGDTDASITGTAMMVEDTSNTLQPAQGDKTNGLDVDVTRSALPTGAATSANQLPNNHDVVVTSAPTTAVTGTFWQATQPVSGTVTETNSAAIKTAVETIDNAIAGSEMQVDVVGALPAGTNAIGKLSANSGVDIGDVDVTSTVLPTGSGTSAVTSVNDTASSTTLKASNAARKQIMITNTSSAVLYVKYGATASTSSFSLLLNRYETLIEDHYNGIVDGIWATDPGDGVAMITEIT